MSKVVWGVAPAFVPAAFRFVSRRAGLGLSATALIAVAATAGLAQTPTTTLPTLTVEAKKQRPKAVKKAARKRKAPAKVEPEPAPPPAPAETATGPVKDYVATRSATGTKTDTPLAEIPQSISVVGKEQIRDQGAQSLQEAIRYMPGLVADGFGYDSRGDYVLIRGIPAAYFLDGMRTAYGFYANTVPAEPYGLERIEVLRGPSSMIYGQSPSGGLINMVSKRPQDFKHGEIGFDYGSYDFGQVKMDVGGPLTADGKWLYRFVGLGRDAETQVDFVDNDRVFLAPSLTYRPSKDTSITLMGTWRHEGGGSVQQFLPHAGTLFPNVNGKTIDTSTFIGEPTDFNDTEQQSVTLLVDHKLFPGLTLHHGTRYTHTDNTYRTHYTAPLTKALIGQVNAIAGFALYDPAKAPFLESPLLGSSPQQNIARVFLWRNTVTDVLTSDTSLTGTFRAGSIVHKVTGGLDYTNFETGGAGTPILVDNIDPFEQAQFDIYNPVYGQNFKYLNFSTRKFINAADALSTVTRRDDETQTQTGIYIQDQIKLGQWSAILGLRQDWLAIEQDRRDDVAQDALTGRAALMYHFRSGLSPYISFSQSFAAQPGNLTLVDTGCDPATEACALRPANPLEGEQVEVGLRYQPPGMPFMISAAVFDLKEKNRLVDDVLSGFARQGAAVRIRGFELEAIGKVTENLKIIGAYTYNDGEFTDHFDAFEIGSPVDGLPQQTAALWGIYTFHDGAWRGLSLGAGVRHIGESRDYGKLVTGVLGEVKTPSFTLFDAMVAYETDDWRWQLTGANLEDEFHVVTCTTRGDCGVGQGRTVITSFTYKF